jgi:hypothetical protein
MSAHTTIKPSAHGSHYGRLSAGVFAIAAAVAGIGLAGSLLVSAPTAPTSQQAPVFDAPAFRAEEHHLRAPAFDANGFRAGERQPLAIGAVASQHEPLPRNR